MGHGLPGRRGQNINQEQYTRACHVPVPIHIVIEGELLVLLDRAISKDAHANVAPDGPFGHIAIRIAAVIRKSADTPSLGGIDKLEAMAMSSSNKGSKRSGNAYFVLLQHHEIKVTDALGRVFAHAFLERRMADNVADVFIHECVPVDRSRPTVEFCVNT